MSSKIVPRGNVLTLENNNFIIYEKDLPFPYVHYPSGSWRGAFFAFQETRNGSLFYCSCQKKGIEVYLRSRERFPGMPVASNEIMIQQFIHHLQFKDKLCHVCNMVCLRYGYEPYTNRSQTKFYSIYGYYINGLSYQYGIGIFGEILNSELIPPDILPSLIAIDGYDGMRLDEQSLKDFRRYCENIIRTQMGYFPIGKKWTSEIKLLDLVRKLYPQYTVIHQYELDNLRADIYIKELKLVIEYQGEQHFKSFDFMGGEEGLKKTQARDKEKVELCNYYNLGILYFTYQDQLTEEFVKDRISSYINNCTTQKTEV